MTHLNTALSLAFDRGLNVVTNILIIYRWSIHIHCLETVLVYLMFVCLVSVILERITDTFPCADILVHICGTNFISCSWNLISCGWKDYLSTWKLIPGCSLKLCWEWHHRVFFRQSLIDLTSLHSKSCPKVDISTSHRKGGKASKQDNFGHIIPCVESFPRVCISSVKWSACVTP